VGKRRVTATGIIVLIFFLILGVLVSIRFTGIGNNFPNPVGGALHRVLSPVEGALLKVGNGIL
jgi:rod shape-determining protein MreC